MSFPSSRSRLPFLAACPSWPERWPSLVSTGPAPARVPGDSRPPPAPPARDRKRAGTGTVLGRALHCSIPAGWTGLTPPGQPGSSQVPRRDRVQGAAATPGAPTQVGFPEVPQLRLQGVQVGRGEREEGDLSCKGEVPGVPVQSLSSLVWALSFESPVLGEDAPVLTPSVYVLALLDPQSGTRPGLRQLKLRESLDQEKAGQVAILPQARGTRQWSATTRRPSDDQAGSPSSPVSRVVYNGKRNSSPRSPPNSSEIFTPAHEENVRFIYEAWQGVERDLRNQLSGSERGLVEEYVEKVPNPGLKTFKPIDLSDLRRRSTQDAKKS
ncbi:PREDICTED: uncharacterized protein LOC102847032 [Elephantulus edwardii]|uniref:uncharacterized protein LOC102847032 n=1 Tax=Elephantulus edwardii TaxID=28737 RepID=UPI0003F080FE|nr:PREDICTED: uncharacterized protein LOC102847032 [Elephantulus edwardii]